jgi:aminoglycoside phosphotransferase (APT) family kinase protein
VSALPLDSVTTWLRAHAPFDISGPLTATLLANGRSNLTYRVTDAAGRSWAIRRPPLGHVMPTAHDLTREYTVLTGLSGNYPVPRPWLLCGDDSVIGVPFLVMDFIEGTVIADRAGADRLSTDQADRVCRLLVDSLARLHAVDAVACGLGGFGKPEGYLARQVRRWGEQWQLSKTRELASMDVMARWLGENVATLAPDLPWSIVHGDFRVDNMIVATDASEVRAVVDWEMSTLGDPIADLAVTLVYWAEAGDGLRAEVAVAEGLTAGPGFWTREQIVDHYATISGRGMEQLGFCLVLACYKLAVIMESLNHRARMGMQLGRAVEQGEDTEHAVVALAQLGERQVDDPDVATLRS